MPENYPIYAPYFFENIISERCDQTVYRSVPILNKNMLRLTWAKLSLS